MQNILKKVFKNLKKASCLALSLLLIFASVPMVFAEDDFTTYEEQQELLAAVQEFIIKAVSLSPEERNALVDILKDVDEAEDINDVIEEANNNVAEIFEVDLEDQEQIDRIEKALEKYDGFGDTIKNRTKDFIEKVEYPESLEGYEGFESIAGVINEDITGDPEDDTGIKFLIASLSYISKYTGIGAMAFHSDDDTELIQFKVDFSDALKGEIADLLDSTEILKDKIEGKDGENSFEQLLTYLEDTVNECESEEISEFKEFLKEETEVFGENNLNVSSATGEVGKKVPVTISLNSIDRIAGLNFIIKYDSDVFEVKQGDITVDKENIEDNIEQDDINEEIKEGDYIVFDYGEGSFDELVDNTNGRVPFSFITIYSLLNNEDIDLLTINFSIKSTATPGDYSIDIIEVDACNDADNPEDVFVHVNAGTIKVIVDKEDLAYAIQYAESLDGRDYTSATWKNLIDALNAARAVYNDENATQAQVDNALAVLEAAIDNLKPVGGTTPPPYTPRRTSSRTSRGVYGYPAPELPDVPSNHWAKPYMMLWLMNV